MIRRLTFIFLIITTLGYQTRAELIVNEVLANEPGSDNRLEWVELFNNATTVTRLPFYSIRVTTTSVDSSFDFIGYVDSVLPMSYLVLCQDSLRFEEHFGDSSGVWGDTPIETMFVLVEMPLPVLINSSGSFTLLKLLTIKSEISWSSSGSDGISLERIHPDSLTIKLCIDPTGSTPGAINSNTPLPNDLSVDSVYMSLSAGLTQMEFVVTNRGLDTITNATLQLHFLDTTQVDSLGQLFASEIIGPLVPGFSTRVIAQFKFLSNYQPVVAVLSDDDRLANNRLDFVAPGTDFPPLVISEFLANPTALITSEWIEIKNISLSDVDIAGWRIADSAGSSEISSVSFHIPPDGYLVIAADSAAFNSSYPFYNGLLIEPSGWQTLNNNGDMISLIAPFLLEADRFVYDMTFSDNHSWGVSESGSSAGEWGRSEDPGGTPGAMNVIRFGATGNTSLTLETIPRIIAPDGDGYRDNMSIIVSPPEANSYKLIIYDSEGRKVRTFEDGAVDLKAEYSWNGRSDSGERLQVGLYIVYFEASGVESVKKTVVLAR